MQKLRGLFGQPRATRERGESHLKDNEKLEVNFML